MKNNISKKFFKIIVYLADVENIDFRIVKPIGVIITPKDDSVPIQLDQEKINQFEFNIQRNDDNTIILSPQFLS